MCQNQRFFGIVIPMFVPVKPERHAIPPPLGIPPLSSTIESIDLATGHLPRPAAAARGSLCRNPSARTQGRMVGVQADQLPEKILRWDECCIPERG